MNEDMPWVNLTQEEVEELRNKKHELTEYGKQRLKELMNKDLTFKTNGEETFSISSQTLENLTLGTKAPETQLEVKEMTHEEMLEEAARREAENKALAALDELYEKHGDAMLKLAEIEKDEWERRERADTVLARYNRFYNDECSGMPHGTPITPEHMQAMALECAVDALICENMNVEYNVIAIDDIKDLIAGLYRQSDEFLKRVQEFKDSADGVA
jgi:hypothetical protein